MKRTLILSAILLVSWVGQAAAQDASGTVTSELTVESSCRMGTDAIIFSETFAEGHSTSWSPEAQALTFACSRGARYSVSANRVASSSGSVDLANGTSEPIPYTASLNSIEVENEL